MILLTTIVIIFTGVLLLKWKYTYWKRKKVPYLTPRMLFGNIQNPLTRNISPAEEYRQFYNTIKSNNWKHAGVYSFSTPVYVPIDLEYIKNILAKDFHYFDERGRYFNEKDDPISAHLFNIGGTKWKELRKKFTPTFSSAKLKCMFDNVLICGEALENTVAKYCEKQEPLEIKHMSENYTAEIIGLCVFSVRFNTLQNPNSEVLVQMKKFLRGNLMEAARMVLTFSFPELSKFLKIVRYDRQATDFFTGFITDLINYRKTKDIKERDFLQLLIDLKDGEGLLDNGTKPHNNTITMEQLLAQAMLFFVAGYDASATTIALALYELSVDEELQEKVRNEINTATKSTGGLLTYDNVGQLTYMQQVLNETLRKYPPLAILNRQSNAAYQIPKTDVVLDKGTPVIIPLLGLHYDPEYFPNPEKFDPDRFSPENVSNIIPYSFLPFGEGPKGCLGMRFGLLKNKVALSILLKKYKFTLNPKTEIPFKFQMGILNTVRGGIWLNVEKLP